MSEPRVRRKKILVDGKLQLGISLQIIGYVYLYMVLFAILANFHSLRTVIFESSNTVTYVQAVTRLQIFVEVFVIPLGFTFLCMCLHGVLFTHRLAGPVYRFKSVLREIRSGNLRQEVRIRDQDYFHDLCGEVNSLLDGLRGDFLKFREVSVELAEKGERLASSGDLPEEAQVQLLEIANASSMLRRLVDGYQLGGSAEQPAQPVEAEETDPVYAES